MKQAFIPSLIHIVELDFSDSIPLNLENVALQRVESVIDFGDLALAVVNEFSPDPLAKDSVCSIYVCTIYSSQSWNALFQGLSETKALCLSVNDVLSCTSAERIRSG